MTEKKYKNKKWLENQYNKLKKPTTEICKICNCSNETIRYWLIKFEIKRRNKSEIQIGELNHQYGKKYTEKEKKIISEKVKRAWKNPKLKKEASKRMKKRMENPEFRKKTIKNLTENRKERLDESHKKNISRSHLKNRLDIEFFKNINTEEKAYWLGFLYADGNIYKNRIGIGLKGGDIKHLFKFKKSLKSKNKVSYKEFQQKNKTYNKCSIYINSYEMANDLKKWGCIPNKSSKLFKLPDIPKDLMRHFIRGYFDGDGSIFYDKRRGVIHANFTGNYPFIKSINMFLYNENIFDKRRRIVIRDKRKKTTSNVTYDGEIAERILNYLYKKSSIFLDRKYNIFKKISF